MSGNFLYESFDQVGQDGFVDETFLLKKEDFIDFFSKFYRDKKANDADRELHDVRLLQWFVASQLNGIEIEEWVPNFIARRILKVLVGADWGEIFSLPWVENNPYEGVYTEAEVRNLKIFCDIKNLVSQKGIKLTGDNGAIGIIADEYNVDYQTARKAYYAINKQVKDVSVNTNNKDKKR